MSYPGGVTDIHQHLKADHQRLLEQFATLVVRDAPADGQASALADFECALIAHFEAEEAQLFPVLDGEFGEEIRALREEHELIRRQFGDLLSANGPAKTTLAQALSQRLQRHAEREDGMLYTLVNDRSESERYQRLVTYLEDLYLRIRRDED